NALDNLLSQEDTHVHSGPVVHIFWTRDSAPFSFATLISQAQPAEVREFLKTAWRARPEAARLDTTPFYAAALSASGSRIVVRDWIETTLGEAQRHLERYFELQRLRGYDGEEHWFPLWMLTQATVNAKARKEEPAPQVGQALLHLALHGGELPMWLLYQAVRRVRAEQGVQSAHAALIKMVLQSQGAGQDMSKLDMTNRDPAYLCGRLLAVLESIQYAALGETNATIVDRYFGTASSAPASVFGRLLRGAQPHLATLRRGKPGAFARLDEALREISTGLETFPYTLSLEKQGLFALGYYHQRASDISAAREKKAAKVGVGAASGESDGNDA
ncbi:MAG TPA: type I-C CRISPR-associated protein Cas8c/Csd1, partial [Ktedonobacterales bacterium]|nr:type I-C CRISPR-associated protein Cas8c/Csd1 [Ktedonobacterales bacterium]